jgi:hypothetical protein
MARQKAHGQASHFQSVLVFLARPVLTVECIVEVAALHKDYAEIPVFV